MCMCSNYHAFFVPAWRTQVLQGPAGSTALKLAPDMLQDAGGSTWSAPPAVAAAIARVNAALKAYRAKLAGAAAWLDVMNTMVYTMLCTMFYTISH